ncbi:DNA cytosine methyltransferase, partial [Escherichia coli]|nr:DNA cytosine methyltransferase [Escherichia coli]
YTVYYNIFAAKDFGVPQNRERIYIVGFNKEKVRNHEHFTFPTPLKTKTRVGDCDALSLETGITNATMFEVGVKTRIIQRSREVILMADHSKFDA